MEEDRKLTFFSKRRLKRQFAEWASVFRPGSEADYFGGVESMPPFDLKKGDEFCPVTAWWLAELCRLAYTPNHIEKNRRRFQGRPERMQILEGRTSFREVHSVHKLGNHAAIFVWKDESGKEATVLCFRGTSKTRQWIMNAIFRPHRWKRFRMPDQAEGCFVHSGFYVLFKKLWPKVITELEVLPRPWIFTGHSLGGALATIAGMVAGPDAVYTFGSPKIGNQAMAESLRAYRLFRVVNSMDLVPGLPVPRDRLGEKNFAHSVPWIHFDESGKLEEIPSVPIERVPLLLKEAVEDLSRPPDWLLDHRVGEYCRKLRKVAQDSLLD